MTVHAHISVLGKLKQDGKFRPAWARQRDPVSKKEKVVQEPTREEVRPMEVLQPPME